MARDGMRQQDPVDDPSSVPTDEDEEETKKKLIGGFPDDYSVPVVKHGREEMGDIRFRRPSQSYIGANVPTYYVGDEYIPANFPGDQIWALQQALAKVGLLTGTFSKQVWDGPTRNAYKALLALANAQGINANTALEQMMSQARDQENVRYTVDENGNIVPVGSGEEVPPLIMRTTDPKMLRQTFRRAVIDTLGEGWSEAEINKMVEAYNNVERMRQTQAYNMELAGEGGEIVDIPSPEAFVQSEILRQDPVGAQTEEALGFVGEFMNNISSPAWGVG